MTVQREIDMIRDRVKHDTGVAFYPLNDSKMVFQTGKAKWEIQCITTAAEDRLVSLSREPYNLYKYSGYAHICRSYKELLRWLNKDEMLMSEAMMIPLFEEGKI